MTTRNLPERASLEYLKKVAKERLAELRTSNREAKLADAQLSIAREYGFSSWRALKAEVDRRRAPALTQFFEACSRGDVDLLRELLKNDPSLARARGKDGNTGLHHALRRDDAVRPADVVKLLLDHGADPNAREQGDNASPLHLAAANKFLDSVRLLLDAGADVQGSGDLHKGDVIGWAIAPGNEAVINLLLERGARHHIFSAMALGDLDLVRSIVAEDRRALSRRRSRFENSQTPLHAAFAPADGIGVLGGQPNYPMLQLLIELGADLEATDDKGRTPLALAMLRGDREAMRILKAAGAKEPHISSGKPSASESGDRDLRRAAQSISKSAPLFWVPDMRETVRWYESIGFTVNDTYEEGGHLMFASMSFGKGELAFTPGAKQGPTGLSFWFFTDRIEELYRLLKERQLRTAHAAMTGLATDEPEVRFDQDLHDPFYGGRQFDIRDNNGLSLIFWQPGGAGPTE